MLLSGVLSDLLSGSICEMERTLQAVRRRITEILREHGSATVAELADELGMAQVSVRHHLDILVGEEMVELNGLRRRDGAGRPSQMYALTQNAYKLFPQRHDVLVGSLLTELKAALPDTVIRSVLQRVAEHTAEEAPQPGADQSFEERLDQIADFLTSRGYNARWMASANQEGCYELHACNCPYAGVSDHHPEICTMDQAMLQHLVPGVVRLETRVLNGATHCRYLVPAPESPAQLGVRVDDVEAGPEAGA
jgi:predicted ArsR family transcriptional regulator